MKRFSLLFLLSFSLLVSCAQPTDSTNEGTVERERVEVSGSISEDAVWESGKDYVVVGDVVVEENSVLTIEPDMRIFVKADREEDYYGLLVKGRLLADGGDSLHAIRFAPVRWSVQGEMDLWRVPGSWKGVWFSSSADSSSVVRYVRIEYAQVGIKGNRCGLRVEQVEVAHCADTGILFNGSDWRGVGVYGAGE